MHDARGAHAFVTVARLRSFTGAARAMGMTPSALSQAVRGLETRLGVPLLVRTTRSVALTDVGRRLLARLEPALAEVDGALDEAGGAADVVQGTLRITAGHLTVPLVVAPVLPMLLDEHPELAVEIVVDDRFVDIVASGFDAGIRLNEAIEPDFTAVRLTPPFRLVVAGTPGYFAKHGRPKRPDDLLAHDCINFRMSSTGAFYAWELEQGGKERSIAVRGRVATNDGATMIHAALAGLGLVYVHEPAIAEHVARGELSIVLSEHAVSVPGFFLYFPRRSSTQPKLRAFIDAARRVLSDHLPATKRPRARRR